MVIDMAWVTIARYKDSDGRYKLLKTTEKYNSRAEANHHKDEMRDVFRSTRFNAEIGVMEDVPPMKITPGKWYCSYTRMVSGDQPKFRFVKVIKKIGKPYRDENTQCQKVELETYAYRCVGNSCQPYVSDSDYYMPTVMIGRKEGIIRKAADYERIEIGSVFNSYDPWDGKPIAVTTHYSVWD